MWFSSTGSGFDSPYRKMNFFIFCFLSATRALPASAEGEDATGRFMQRYSLILRNSNICDSIHQSKFIIFKSDLEPGGYSRRTAPPESSINKQKGASYKLLISDQNPTRHNWKHIQNMFTNIFTIIVLLLKIKNCSNDKTIPDKWGKESTQHDHKNNTGNSNNTAQDTTRNKKQDRNYLNKTNSNGDDGDDEDPDERARRFNRMNETSLIINFSDFKKDNNLEDIKRSILASIEDTPTTNINEFIENSEELKETLRNKEEMKPNILASIATMLRVASGCVCKIHKH